MPIIEHTNHTEQVLAGTFIGVLARWLSDEDFKEFLRRTREDYQEATCHSGDLCDSNMAMAEAFSTAFGQEVDMESDEELTLWNAAWSRAKRFIAGRD